MLTSHETRILKAVSVLAYGNPFLEARVEAERVILDEAFVPPEGGVWNSRSDATESSANVQRITDRVEAVVARIRSRVVQGLRLRKDEIELYHDLVNYVVYYRYQEQFLALCQAGPASDTTHAPFYTRFRHDLQTLLKLPGTSPPTEDDCGHLFACHYQVRRAFHYIFQSIVGGSEPAAKLRAAVWQSVFSCDTRRYRRCLFDRMGDMPLLITGPSGTGKELVARAVALSRYIPFDPASRRFGAGPRGHFFALNLSALSPTLIESELFGHRRGTFTGALEDRGGWLEACGPYGTVFLDEIGEIDQGIQVKLLRVLETRRYQRLGETIARTFDGKLVAATNRDLGIEMDKGRFRRDLYYRLCSDMVRTPSLREQLDDRPEELDNLVQFLCHRVVPSSEAPALAAEVAAWVRDNLGEAYPWPGNVRELDQCVRNILIRSAYTPPRVRGGNAALAEALRQSPLTADEVVRLYCQVVYKDTGNYVQTARRLGLDRRTVKSRVAAATAPTDAAGD